MNLIVVAIILILHLAGSFLALAVLSRRIPQRREYAIPILFVPIFGPLMALTIELLYRLEQVGKRPVDLESMRLGNDIYWTKFTQSPEGKDVVPLEEAILIDGTSTRRKAMLDTFQDDSLNYLDILMVARRNEDVDTTHYATIQISKIQRHFQLELQKYARAVEEEPDNIVLLDEYIERLGEYLESCLPEQSILKHQRHNYAKLLDKKLSLAANDRQTLIRKLRNCSELKEDFASTLDVIRILGKNWPKDEQVWIETLRAYVEWQDRARLQETIHEMQKASIEWTKQGKEMVRPWVQV